MGGIHFTMNEQQEFMERERKLDEVYQRYFDSRPGFRKRVG